MLPVDLATLTLAFVNASVAELMLLPISLPIPVADRLAGKAKSFR